MVNLIQSPGDQFLPARLSRWLLNPVSYSQKLTAPVPRTSEHSSSSCGWFLTPSQLFPFSFPFSQLNVPWFYPVVWRWPLFHLQPTALFAGDMLHVTYHFLYPFIRVTYVYALCFNKSNCVLLKYSFNITLISYIYYVLWSHCVILKYSLNINIITLYLVPL